MKILNKNDAQTILLSLGLFACKTVLALETQSVGELFGESIVDVYAPPTRSGAPIVATASELYQWNEDDSTWVNLYSPPWTGTLIEGVNGYKKSSKALYLTHSAGIAVSSDGGDVWEERIPPKFSEDRGKYVSIAVDPNQRKRAAVAFENRLWTTTDYGESFQIQEAPSHAGKIRAIAFLEIQENTPPALAIVYEKGLECLTGESLQTTRNSISESNSIAFASFHENRPIVYLQDAAGAWSQFKLSAPFEARIKSGRSVAKYPQILPFPAGNVGLWLFRDKEVAIFNLDTGDSTLVATLPFSPSIVRQHPREQSSLYLAGDRRLYLASDSFVGIDQTYARLDESDRWTLATWKTDEPSPSTSTATVQTQTPRHDRISESILAAQPSLPEVLATIYENYGDEKEALAKASKLARTRHLLPEARLELRTREYPTDQSLLVTEMDRFGFESTNDLRLSDKLEKYNWVGVVLEWDLPSMRFDDDQLEALAERRKSFEARREIAQEVSELYYKRIECLVELEGGFGTPTLERRSKVLLLAHQITDLINAYCGRELLKSP